MADFAKKLTLFDFVLIATGGAIGSGIFRTPGEVAQHAGSPAWMIAAWVAGGAVTLSGALTFAELGASMPRAGGIYVWLSEAYGGIVGFLHGWAYFTVVATGALAALALVFAEYLSFFVPMGAVTMRLVAIGALVALAVINVVGVRAAAILGDALTVVKLAAIAAIVALAFALGTSDRANWAWHVEAPTSSAFAAALVGVLWSYGGWQHASFAAGEAKRAARDVPLGMVVGSLLVTAAYVLANVAYVRLLPWRDFETSQYVASQATEAAIGRAGGAVVASVIASSAIGTAGIYTLTTPRVYWAMSERGLFFRGVAEIHPRWKTPVRAIALQTAWASALVLLWGTFKSLVSYVVFVDYIFFALTGFAVIVMRRRRAAAKAPRDQEPERAYRVPGYPLVPLAFVATCVWFVASTLVAQPAQAIAGAALLGLGVPVCLVWRARRSG